MPFHVAFYFHVCEETQWSQVSHIPSVSKLSLCECYGAGRPPSYLEVIHDYAHDHDTTVIVTVVETGVSNVVCVAKTGEVI